MSMPTLVMFHHGERVSQVVGAQPKGKLRAQIDEAIALDAVPATHG
jgi:thioredoxin-like negative regulator of GroEL